LLTMFGRRLLLVQVNYSDVRCIWCVNSVAEVVADRWLLAADSTDQHPGQHSSRDAL